MRTDKPRLDPVLVLGIALEGGLGLLAWGLGWLIGQPALERFRWGLGDAALGVAACLPMLLVFFVCVRWPVGPLARIKQFSEEVIRPLFAPCSLLDLAAVSLLAGLCEEMLFRGVLQTALSEGLHPAVGIAVAGAVFGLAHLVTPTYALLAALLGAYLGWWFHATDNLLVVVLAHALYDFVALVCLVRGPAPGREPGGDA